MADARQDVTKKVRMSRDRADRLATLARKTGKSESELLREGLDLIEWQEHQREALQYAIDLLQPGEKYVKDRLIFQ
jgi:predicted DNA-binding protein